MSHPKLQHYVPLFILKGFARGKKRRLQVFDKRTESAFSATVARVAGENAFYDVAIEAGVLTAEPALQSLESEAAKTVTSIRNSQSLAGLTNSDRAIVALLIATEYLRTRSIREVVKDADERLASRLMAEGADLSAIQNYRPFESDEDIKHFSLRMLESTSAALADEVLKKDWLLIRTTLDAPFWISDNPVALYNERTFDVRGNIGFAVPGIQINLPLSETLSLLAICKSNMEDLRDGLVRLRARPARTPAGRAMAEEAEVAVQPLIDAVEKGLPLQATREHILHHNSLQVIYAERWLFAGTADFSMARDVIRGSEDLRRGPRFDTA